MEQKCYKIPVVILSYAVVHKRTVMIHTFDTIITMFTVRSSRRFINPTCSTHPFCVLYQSLRFNPHFGEYFLSWYYTWVSQSRHKRKDHSQYKEVSRSQRNTWGALIPNIWRCNHKKERANAKQAYPCEDESFIITYRAQHDTTVQKEAVFSRPDLVKSSFFFLDTCYES